MDMPQAETIQTADNVADLDHQPNAAVDQGPARGEVRTGRSSDILNAEVEQIEDLYGGGSVEPRPAPAEANPLDAAENQDRQDGNRSAPQMTAEDAATLTALQYEAQSFERDIQDFAAAKSKLAEMEQTDPERARAYAPQVAAAERELRQRYETIQGAAQHFMEGTNNRRLTTERELLVEAVPELGTSEGKAALRGDLLEHWGFSEQEIKVPDSRLVRMAWESMQYRKMTKSPSTERKPKAQKVPPPPPPRAPKKRSKFDESVANFKAQHGRPPTKGEEAAIRIYGHGKPDTFRLPKSTERDAADILYGKR